LSRRSWSDIIDLSPLAFDHEAADGDSAADHQAVHSAGAHGLDRAAAADRSPDCGSARHTGGYAAWLGGLRGETTAIQQQASISAAMPHLTYWHWIGSADYCGYDKAYVRVNGATVNSYNLCAMTNTGGWVKRTVNLSAYAGQSVALQLRVVTDGSLNSNLFVDDFGFQAASAVIEADALAPEPDAAEAPVDELKPAEPPAGQAPAEALLDEAGPQVAEAPVGELKPSVLPAGQALAPEALADTGE
jgi:hypothetical protein